MYYLIRRKHWSEYIHLSIWEYSPEKGSRKTRYIQSLTTPPMELYGYYQVPIIKEYCDGIPYEYIERDMIARAETIEEILFEAMTYKMELEERERKYSQGVLG